MPKQTKIKPKRVIFTFEPTKIVQKRLLWLRKDFGGLNRTSVINSCIEAEYQRRRALQKVGRMSQELRGTMPQTVTFTPGGAIPGFTAGQLGQPADTLQSDIRKLVDLKVCRKAQGRAEAGNTCLKTPGTCESCPDWAAESKGSDK